MSIDMVWGFGCVVVDVVFVSARSGWWRGMGCNVIVFAGVLLFW